MLPLLPELILTVGKQDGGMLGSAVLKLGKILPDYDKFLRGGNQT